MISPDVQQFVQSSQGMAYDQPLNGAARLDHCISKLAHLLAQHFQVVCCLLILLEPKE